jgi:hypothetical protein
MGTLMRISVTAVSVYILVWGVTWLTGDLSRGAFGTMMGVEFGFYPGVFLGGLPPRPSFDSDLPLGVAVVLGVVGLLAVVLDWRRRRSAPN